MVSAPTENGKKVLTMAEYVTKEQVINWYRPYGQTDEPIPFETLASDLRDMKAADVAPVRHARWDENGRCSNCGGHAPFWCMASTYYKSPWCQECGAEMDLEG